jgi:hypothetical protein
MEILQKHVQGLTRQMIAQMKGLKTRARRLAHHSLSHLKFVRVLLWVEAKGTHAQYYCERCAQNRRGRDKLGL